MDPGSLALMAAVAQTAGQVVDGVEGYQQGKAEAGVAGQNAQLARDNAARARQDASMAEEAQRRAARQSLGRSAAAVSEAGIGSPGTGSAGAALKQASTSAELDALNIRYGGETEANQHLVEAAQFDAERRAALRRAKAAAVSGVLGSAASALSGAANYGTYQSNQRLLTSRSGAGGYGGASKPGSASKAGAYKPTRAGKAPIAMYGGG